MGIGENMCITMSAALGVLYTPPRMVEKDNNGNDERRDLVN